MSASDSTPRTGQNGDGAQLLEREAVSILSGHFDLLRDQANQAESRADSLGERIQIVRSMRAQLRLTESMLVEARDDQEGSS
ncbi:hypothetical protein GJ633_14730 [Halorubrum sp. CBA1125]|uniref:hypothetical protein n=1 Tax=Halorubrum sp. CBA1125 TaxID=2668072 RepID=UPI0012E7AFE2|nr:hypothetical protein [Halorubrum sp. CBA1125]MUW15737.1 hypothetical protein [Halorubrum sp. CBA1125]